MFAWHQKAERYCTVCTFITGLSATISTWHPYRCLQPLWVWNCPKTGVLPLTRSSLNFTQRALGIHVAHLVACQSEVPRIMQVALLSALILPDTSKLMDFSTSVGSSELPWASCVELELQLQLWLFWPTRGLDWFDHVNQHGTLHSRAYSIVHDGRVPLLQIATSVFHPFLHFQPSQPCCIQHLCDPRQYLLSFFQFMDIIGTISMAFDISFLLGAKANEQQSQITTGKLGWHSFA